jgi:hypothetical protein
MLNDGSSPASAEESARTRPPVPSFGGPPAPAMTPDAPVATAPTAPASGAQAASPLAGRPLLAAGAIAAALALLGLGFALRAGDDGSSEEAAPSIAQQRDNQTSGAADPSAPPATGDEGTSTGTGQGASPALGRTQTRERNVSRAIRAHWKQRLAGDVTSLAAAYDAYAGPVGRRVGTKARWMKGIRADGLNVMTIGGVLVHDVSSTSARAVARVHTESDRGGCADWTMRYKMRRIDGHWRISDSTADKAGC